MAAPTPTTRVTPTARMLENGFRSYITFASDPNIVLYEIEVKPTGREGGDPIDLGTMHTQNVIPQAPNSDVYKSTPGTVKFGYDASLKNEIKARVNQHDTLTETYPNGDTYCYYGFLQNVDFDPLVKGQMPTGTATFVETNWDYVNKTEEEAVYTAAGT